MILRQRYGDYDSESRTPDCLDGPHDGVSDRRCIYGKALSWSECGGLRERRSCERESCASARTSRSTCFGQDAQSEWIASVWSVLLNPVISRQSSEQRGRQSGGRWHFRFRYWRP